MDEMLKTAMEVNPERISIPTEAATCDPGRHLRPARAEVFKK